MPAYLFRSDIIFAAVVQTTGSPRVGNQAFATAYNSKVPNTTRFVHNDDEVPHIPTKLFGFYHVATEVWERPDNGQESYTGICIICLIVDASFACFTVCNGGEDTSCSQSVNGLQWDLGDHMVCVARRHTLFDSS